MQAQIHLHLVHSIHVAMVTSTHHDLVIAGGTFDRGGRVGVGEVLGDQLHEGIVIHANADDTHVGGNKVLLPIAGENGVISTPHLLRGN